MPQGRRQWGERDRQWLLTPLTGCRASEGNKRNPKCTQNRAHTHTQDAGRTQDTGHSTGHPLVPSLCSSTDDECAAQLLLLLVEATLRRPIYPNCHPSPPPPLCALLLLLPPLVTAVRQCGITAAPQLPRLPCIASRKRTNIHDIPDIVAIVAAVVIVSFRFVFAAFFFSFSSSVSFFLLSLLSLVLLLLFLFEFAIFEAHIYLHFLALLCTAKEC